MATGGKTGHAAVCAAQVHAREAAEFVSCPTATLLKHDVVTGATLMFRVNDPAVLLAHSSVLGARWMAGMDDCAALASGPDSRAAD